MSPFRVHPALWPTLAVTGASVLAAACGGGCASDGGGRIATNSITPGNSRATATAASALVALEALSGAADLPAAPRSWLTSASAMPPRPRA